MAKNKSWLAFQQYDKSVSYRKCVLEVSLKLTTS